MTGPVRLVVSRRYAFAPSRVFDAWTDPVLAGKWLFATDQGELVRVEMDARVGGRFLFVDRRPEGDAAHYGVFLELDRPRRLAFSFSVEDYDVNAGRVTVDIAPAEGGCVLTLTQELAPEWADYKERTEKGWATLLANLEKALAP